ncbi:MAG: glycosyltransferase [bacterium]|nr:glycosyltransferase [bacterium]
MKEKTIAEISKIKQLILDKRLSEAAIRIEALIELYPDVEEIYTLGCEIDTLLGRGTENGEGQIVHSYSRVIGKSGTESSIPEDQGISGQGTRKSEYQITETDRKKGREMPKLAIICGEGMDGFIDDIIKAVSNEYNTKKFVIRNTKDVEKEIQMAVDWADIVWFEWANDVAVIGTNYQGIIGKKVIVRLHSYEVFANFPPRINWSVVNTLVFVANHIKEILKRKIPDIEKKVKIEVINNGVDVEKFVYKTRKPGFNIAYVGYINYKKNPAMALQIIKKLVDIDSRYKLHIAGDFQEPRYKVYFEHMIEEMKLKNNVVFYGWQANISEWVKDKNYLLLTSVHEGHPYCVMEAMASGIKPAIHNYYGAKEQWPEEILFNSIDEAVEIFKSKDYNSAKYRKLIESECSLEKQIGKIKCILEDSISGDQEIGGQGTRKSENQITETDKEKGTGEKVQEFYDNFLNHLIKDKDTPNLRHKEFKSFMKTMGLKGKSVLDLGCGIGITSKFMAEQGAFVTAVDISPKNIQYAKEHFSDTNVNYIVQDITTLKLNKIFNMIIIEDVFEHIPRDRIESLLGVIKSHSNEGTIIYLNIPDGRYQKFIKQHYPRLQQIIDESYSIDEVVAFFASINMSPLFMKTYGLDVPFQYNQYLFATEGTLFAIYRDSFKNMTVKNG